MQEKINKFNAKVEQIKGFVTGNVDVTSILINSNRIHFHKIKDIVKSFNGRLRVDYLLTAEIRDENNGNFHILGGRKLEDYICHQLIDFARIQKIEYLMEQRILGMNGEIDIILITNNTSDLLETKLLDFFQAHDDYHIFKDRKPKSSRSFL